MKIERNYLRAHWMGLMGFQAHASGQFCFWDEQWVNPIIFLVLEYDHHT